MVDWGPYAAYLGMTGGAYAVLYVRLMGGSYASYVGSAGGAC
jgi:hypothetical protein